MKRCAVAVLVLSAAVMSGCFTIPIDFDRDGGSDAGLPGRTCNTTSDCRAPLVCDPTNRTCVECQEHSDCPADAGTPACNALTGRCVPCGASNGCTAPTSCKLESEACVRVCTQDFQCTGFKEGCRGKVCAVCESDADCPGKHCDFATGRCVACANDTHCGGGQPKCQTSTGTCVRCLTNTECPETTSCLAGECVAAH